MIFDHSHRWLACSLFLVSLFSGCGGGVKPPNEDLVSGSGTIKLDGKPAAAVRVRLTPIEDTKSVGGAWGVTDDEGHFTLTHWTNKDGIAPGSYLITFSKLVKPDGTPLGEKDSPALVQAREVIAPQWSDPAPDKRFEMTRRVDIPDAGRDDIEFSITSAPGQK